MKPIEFGGYILSKVSANVAKTKEMVSARYFELDFMYCNETWQVAC